MIAMTSGLSREGWGPMTEWTQPQTRVPQTQDHLASNMSFTVSGR